MKIAFLLCGTYLVFSQLSLLVSAVLAYLGYLVGKTFPFYQHQGKRPSLGLWMIVLEIMTMAILIPLLYSWFTLMAVNGPVLWVCVFAASELLPAVLKYHKIKEVLMKQEKTIENPIYK